MRRREGKKEGGGEEEEGEEEEGGKKTVLFSAEITEKVRYFIFQSIMFLKVLFYLFFSSFTLLFSSRPLSQQPFCIDQMSLTLFSPVKGEGYF